MPLYKHGKKTFYVCNNADELINDVAEHGASKIIKAAENEFVHRCKKEFYNYWHPRILGLKNDIINKTNSGLIDPHIVLGLPLKNGVRLNILGHVIQIEKYLNRILGITRDANTVAYLNRKNVAKYRFAKAHPELKGYALDQAFLNHWLSKSLTVPPIMK